MTKLLKSITSWINKNGNFSNLLKSRIVLYFLFVVSLVNLYTFVSTGNGIYAAVFILVGFLTTFFSKNMIVVMIIALAVSNVFLYGKEIKVEEGFDSMDKEDDHEKNEDKKNEKNEDKEESTPFPTMTKTPATSTTPKPSKITESPEPTPTLVENAKADIKGLLDLEVKLMQGVSEMQPLLEKAKDTVAKLKASVASTSKPSSPNSTLAPGSAST